METQRQDQSSCTVTVDGRELPFVFNKLDGGMVDSEESKTFPGGMRPQKAHGGPQTVENTTLTFEFVPERDNDTIQWLKTRSGKGDAGVVENRLDRDGNVAGIINNFTGVLKSVNTGTYDAGSSDPREGEIEISTHGVVG